MAIKIPKRDPIAPLLMPAPQQARIVVRPDNGRDFFVGNKKVDVNAYTRATGANKQNLVRGFAKSGDAYSQNILNTVNQEMPQVKAVIDDAVSRAQDPLRKYKDLANSAAVFAETPISLLKGVADMGNTAFAGIVGDKARVKAGKEEFTNTIRQSPIMRDVLRPLGNTMGAILAENDLRKQGIDQAIITEEINRQTAPSGISTDNPVWQNNLVLGGAALGLAGTIAAGATAGGRQLNPTKALKDAALYKATDNTNTVGFPTKELKSVEGAPDKVQVEIYKRKMESGKSIDPIIVVRNKKGELEIEDGKHRFQAALELGIETVPVRMVTKYQVTKAGRVGSIGGGARKDRGVNFTDTENVAYQKLQKDREAAYKQNPVVNGLQVAQRELADPRAVQQRLDNRWFSYQKKQGKTVKGQSEVLPKDSLAHQRGIIENPDKAAAIRSSEKYTVNGREHSLDSITKHYGNSEKPRARDFENYRIFKDELENIQAGKKNTLNGTTPEGMAQFVKAYEAKNPLAVEHNAVLRQVSLKNFDDSFKAGIEKADVYKTTSQRQFYNPRKAVDPEDLVKMKMTGGASSSPKATKLRSETAGGPTRSPLEVFYEKNTATEKALASQRYGKIVKERTEAGLIKGARETVSAETTIKHKQAMRDVQDLQKVLKDAKKERNAINSLKRKVSVKSKTALKNAKTATAKQEALKKQNRLELEKRVRDAETAIATKVQKMIDNARGKENDILNDVAQESTKFSRQELLDIGRAVGKSADDIDLPASATKSVRTATNKRIATKKLSNKLQAEVDRINASLQDSRDYVKGIENQKSQTFGEFLETSQHETRGTQTVEYKVDGEIGKIEIPPSLARELEAANKAANESLLEKGSQGIANVQKVTWTGALAPVFKVWNVFLKNPFLAFFNGDKLSAVGLNAVGAFFRSAVGTKAMRSFKREMLKNGAVYENALQSRNIQSTIANDIAARGNLISFFARNPVHTLQDVWKGISATLSHLDNSQRTAVAFGAYKRGLRMGLSEADAKNMASGASAKVFGDFDRISRLARNLEVIYPYSGATQAGARAMGHAWRSKPIETAFKAATFVGTIGAFTAYSLSNNEKYVQDMIDQKKEYELDANITIVLPGAEPDEKGNWSGVVKIPLVPDLRPLNRATWRSVHSAVNGEGVDAGMVATELFNQFSGDSARSFYDYGATNEGKNPTNGILSGSPAINTVKIGSNVNPRTGERFTSDYQNTLDKVDQKDDFTSDAAVNISKGIGGFLSPMQVDGYLAQLGNLGRGIQSREDKEGNETNFLTNMLDFAKPFKPGTSQTESKKDGAEYYKNLMTALAPLNENERNAFTALHPKSKDDNGDSVYTSDSTYNPAARLDIYNRFPKVFLADKELNDKAAAKGKPNNPLFALEPEQVKKVLEHDVLPPGAKDPELSNLYSKEWYVQYSADKSKFFDQISSSQKDSLALAVKEGDNDKIKSITASMAKMDSPDNPYPETPPQVQKYMDAYSALPKGTGARSSWIKANPEAWSAMTSQFAAIDDWQNKQRKKRGLDATEGEEGKANGYGDSSSSFGSGGSSSPDLNPYKYAVSLNAGGKAPGAFKATAKVGALKKYKVNAGSKSGPKVSIKKSKV